MLHKYRVVVALVVAAAVIITSAWLAFRPGRQAAAPDPVAVGPGVPAEVALQPAKPDPAGLDPAGALTLTAQQPLSAAAVRESLTVQPAVELAVEKADPEGKRFTVTPVQPLESNKVYQFRLAPAAGVNRPYQWSFQTRAEFRLLGTLPRHEGADVPVSTGIEFTFTHEDYEDPTPYFALTPKVTGRFERHKKTVSFVPDQPLQAGTVYTVTLKPGLRRTQGEGQLTEESTFSFETSEPSKHVTKGELYLPEGLADFPANDRPVFALWQANGVGPIEVSLYRYPDAAAYIASVQKVEQFPWWAVASRRRQTEDVTTLTQVASFTTVPQTYENGTFLLFPEPLPQGYYLASLKVDGDQRQLRFQVTDLSYHVTATTTQTLVWLNDVATGKPVAGATVTAPGSGESATSGPDGVAVLPTPEPVRTGTNAEPLFLTARAGTKEGVVYGPATYRYYYQPRQENQRDLFWQYLYTDRNLYKPDDTVQVWGVLHPREPGAAAVETVVAEVIRHDYQSYDGTQLALVSATLPVQNSTYTGGLPLPRLSPGHYELRIRQGDEPMISTWFEVAAYSKPPYQLDVTADKRAIFSGEPVTYRVKASFFEGTPVPNLKLDYRLNWSDQSQSVTTDAKGEAVISYTKPRAAGTAHAYPHTQWLHVNASLSEIGEVTAEHTVTLFERDTLTQTLVEQQAGEATVSVQLNQVTLAGIQDGRWDYKGPAIPGREVQFTLTELNWNKIEEGTSYDFIEKVVRPRYRYTEAHKRVGSFTATSDSSGRALYTFPVDPEKQYRVDVQVNDSRGLAITDSTHVSGSRFVPFDRSYRGWHLLTPEVPTKDRATLDEPTGFVMKREDQTLPNRPAGFLFFTARRGLQEHKVQDSATYRLTMKEADLPRTHLHAVHFDGRNYHATSRTVLFDASQRQLQISVTLDKAAYRPGEEVRLQVQVQDRQGRPAAGAQVNLNLVDEALYALREQNVDPLGDLYSDYVPDGVLRSRNSHDVPAPQGGAEKGGEGGGLRQDFKDAVFFATVTTDGQGRATASFKVPDNLTMWRLTYQAVKVQSMEAGHGSTGIPVKLPFFADLMLGESFLVGDQPALQVRAFGEALTGDEEVRFQVEMRSPSGKPHATEVSGRPYSPLSVALPKLEEAGAYTVQVRTSTGSHADALEKRFTAADSYLRQNRVNFTLLTPETVLKGSDEVLTQLTFLDWERGQYLESLYRLSWSWSNRFESKLSRAVARDLLKEHFDQEETWPEPELESFRYQTPAGSIAILPYSDGDLKLSALAADLAAERFDRLSLTRYFQQIMDDEDAGRDRKILALYGLAALEQPVLTTAQSLLAQPDLSVTERLYLALAVAKLGDLESARPIHRAILEEHGEKIGQDLRLKAGEDRDEQLENTALTAALAGALGEPWTPALLSYLRESEPSESLIMLEQLLAIKGGLAWLSDQPVAFTYSLGGKEVRKELRPGESWRMALRPEEVSAIRFKAIHGQVAAVTTYEAPGRPTIEKGGSTITRSYSPAVEQWKAGDIVTVTLNYTVPTDAPNGGYELTDYLPSGLRIVEQSWRYGLQVDWRTYQSWPLQIDGQKVTFWAGKEGKPIRYFARVLSPGEYRAEESVLQHQKSGLIYGLGNKALVKIGW